MIGIIENQMVVTEPCVKLELKEYLDTYLGQYNDMVQTYDWIRPRLNSAQVREWERTIKSLGIVCHALDAGFDPGTPPKNWASGLLFQYMAPIPTYVREAIDKAEPIFGKDHLLIYDPNTEHFQRPKQTDRKVPSRTCRIKEGTR
jgi:hypothetical protein